MVKPLLKLLTVAKEAGVVTRKYPYESPLLTEEFRGKIEIDASICWGCGACVKACPSNALTIRESMDVRELVYFAGRCIFCGRCADVCPTGAIRVTKEFELATDKLEDLEQVVIHRKVKCPICGKHFVPQPLEKYVCEKCAKGEVPTYMMVCPECRRKVGVKKMIRCKGG